MWTLIAGAAVYAVWKAVPRNVVGDILQLEWIRTLQERHQMRPVTAEELESRYLRRLSAGCVAVFVCTFVWAAASVSHGTLPVLMVSSFCTAMYAAAVQRCTKSYRTVTQPLYLTLCSIREARWDTHSNARKWVHVRRRKGVTVSVTVRLPKDWHATKLGISTVSSIVTSRIPGEWEVRADPARYRIQFTPKPVPQSVPVAHLMSVTSAVTASNATHAQTANDVTFVDLEKESESDAW